MKKSIITIFSLLLGFGLVAAACNHSDDSSSTTTTAAAATTTTARATTTTATPATTPPATTTTKATPLPAPADGSYILTVLHNNDGESKLLPSESKAFPGIARFVAALRDLQNSSTAVSNGVITLTSGDNFLASKELNISLATEDTFYDAIALSGLYDAMALGNHDFDFGPDVTERFIKSFNPSIPFLSANTDVTNEAGLKALQDEGKLAASVTITKNGRRIGIIGAITQSLPSISSPRRAVIGNVLDAVQAEATKLTDAGVDIIILVSHLQGIDEELTLTGSLSNIDIVIAGGGDELLKNPSDTCFNEQNAASVAAGDDDDVEEPYSTVYPIVSKDSDDKDVLVVTGPGGYRCIGRLQVNFDSNGVATSWEGSANGVSLTQTPDPTVKRNVEDPLTEGLTELENNIIGTSEVALDGRRPSVRTKETNLGNILADSFIWNGERLADSFNIAPPQVSVTNGGGIRNDSIIPAGDISVSDTFDVAPFSNIVVVMEITRQTFKDLMETTIAAAPDAGGGFAQIGGFGVVYNLDMPAREIDRGNNCAVSTQGSRVRSLTLEDGTPIVQNGNLISGPPVRLAITDFLANGGDCYPLGDIDFTRLGITYQRSLETYIRDGLSRSITQSQYAEDINERIIFVN